MRPFGKHGLWVALSTLAAVVIVALVALCLRGKPTGPGLPAFDGAEVSRYDANLKITAQLLGPADVARLRTELGAAKRVRNDRKMIILPGIRLLHAGVEVQQIRLGWDGQEKFLFVVSGECYQARPGNEMRDLLKISEWSGR